MEELTVITRQGDNSLYQRQYFTCKDLSSILKVKVSKDHILELQDPNPPCTFNHHINWNLMNDDANRYWAFVTSIKA